MPRIENLLEALCSRPILYTGENTLSSIEVFLSGYSVALSQYDIPPEEDLLPPREFHDWVAYRFDLPKTTRGWCQMIRNNTTTEQQAIDTFCSLFAEFNARTPHLVAKLVGIRKSYTHSTNRLENGVVVQSPPVTLSYPDSISLVTYTDNKGFFAYSDTGDSFPGEGYFPDLATFESSLDTDRSKLTIVDETWNPQ